MSKETTVIDHVNRVVYEIVPGDRVGGQPGRHERDGYRRVRVPEQAIRGLQALSRLHIKGYHERGGYIVPVLQAFMPQIDAETGWAVWMLVYGGLYRA